MLVERMSGAGFSILERDALELLLKECAISLSELAADARVALLNRCGATTVPDFFLIVQAPRVSVSDTRVPFGGIFLPPEVTAASREVKRARVRLAAKIVHVATTASDTLTADATIRRVLFDDDVSGLVDEALEKAAADVVREVPRRVSRLSKQSS
jgi:hypothetical protein